MKYLTQRETKSSWKTITTFRLLLWWGVHTMQSFIHPQRTTRPQIVRLSKREAFFDPCQWVFNDDGFYCLHTQKECIEIHAYPGWQKN